MSEGAPTSGPALAKLFEKFTAAAEGRLSLVEAVGAGIEFAAADPALAVAFYATWLARTPEPASAVGWYNLGSLYDELGLAKQAKDACRKAARIAPAMPLFSYGLLRQLVLEPGSNIDEALALCRRLLSGGLYRHRHDQTEIERLGHIYFGTVGLYAALHEAIAQPNCAELFYEMHVAQGGGNEGLVHKLAEMTQKRHALRQASGYADVRLALVEMEIAGSRHSAAPMIEGAVLQRCLSHIDVDVISVLRLGRAGDALRHGKLLTVMSALENCRNGPVRIDRVEAWTDGCGLDMVQVEEVLRSHCLEGLVVRCGGDATEQGEAFLSFLDIVAELRRLYDIDMTLTANVSTQDPAARDRWAALLGSKGWTPDFAPPEPAVLVVGADGMAAGLGNLQAMRYTRLVMAASAA